MEDKRNACGFLEGRREGKRPLGRCRPRWEGTIKMELIEIGWKDVDLLIWFRVGKICWLFWTCGISWLVEMLVAGGLGTMESVSRLVGQSVAQSASQWIKWNCLRFEVVTAVNFKVQFSGLWYPLVLYTNTNIPDISTNILDDCTANFYYSNVEASSIESLIQIWQPTRFCVPEDGGCNVLYVVEQWRCPVLIFVSMVIMFGFVTNVYWPCVERLCGEVICQLAAVNIYHHFVERDSFGTKT